MILKQLMRLENGKLHLGRRIKKYFLNFLNQNNISTLYAHGSYYFLLLKIFRFSDLNLNLGMTYIKFYLSMPIRIIKKNFR